MVEVREIHGAHSTTTHHFTSISTQPPFPLSFSLLHPESIPTERSTPFTLLRSKDPPRKWRGHLATLWGRPAPPLGRPTCCFPLYKSHSFLDALGLQHNTRQPSKFKILEAKVIVEFPLVEVVLEKERVRGSLSVKVVLKS